MPLSLCMFVFVDCRSDDGAINPVPAVKPQSCDVLQIYFQGKIFIIDFGFLARIPREAESGRMLPFAAGMLKPTGKVMACAPELYRHPAQALDATKARRPCFACFFSCTWLVHLFTNSLCFTFFAVCTHMQFRCCFCKKNTG